jgi:hypothetical protein
VFDKWGGSDGFLPIFTSTAMTGSIETAQKAVCISCYSGTVQIVDKLSKHHRQKFHQQMILSFTRVLCTRLRDKQDTV